MFAISVTAGFHCTNITNRTDFAGKNVAEFSGKMGLKTVRMNNLGNSHLGQESSPVGISHVVKNGIGFTATEAFPSDFKGLKMSETQNFSNKDEEQSDMGQESASRLGIITHAVKNGKFSTKGSRSKLTRILMQQRIRSLSMSHLDRLKKKRNFRRLWITRINGAVREKFDSYSYSRFMHDLYGRQVILNRKVLAQIAVSNRNSLYMVCNEVMKEVEDSSSSSVGAADVNEKMEKLGI